MASPQLKAKRLPIPHDERGDARLDPGNANLVARRYQPVRTLTQFDFRTPADPVADYWRAIGALMLVAIAVIAAIAAVTYFTGVIAAAVVAVAVVALVGFGNWILNNTIDL